MSKKIEFDINAEAGVLSCLILNQGLYYEYSENLRDEYFYTTANKSIFMAIREIITSGKELDLIILSQKLKDQNKYDECGGVDYLMKLSDFVLSDRSIILLFICELLFYLCFYSCWSSSSIRITK